MIVQCDQCNAKFRLDDAKVKEEGVKVRCSKCKHVFVVRKEVPAEEPDFDSILGGLESSPSEVRVAVAAASQTPVPEEGPVLQKPSDAAPDDEWAMNFGEVAPGAAPDQGEAAPVGMAPEWLDDGSGGEAASMELQTATATGMESRVDDHSNDLSYFLSAEKNEGKPAEFDLGEFDFSAGAMGQAGGMADTIAEEKTANSSAETAAGDKVVPEKPFSSFDDFGEAVDMGSGERKSSGQEPEEFSFGDPFAEGERGSAIAPGSENEPSIAPAINTEESSSDEFFSFAGSAPKQGAGETFDFSVEDFSATTPVTVSEGEGGPVWDTADSETGATPETQKPGAESSTVPFVAAEEDEMPPSVIPTRRKGSRVVGLVLGALGVLLMLLLVGGGYYYFAKGPAAFDGLGMGAVSKWLGKESTEEGKISVANPVGAFLVNQEAGELFVVTGNAVNDFKKPRAAIQIKVTLYGPKGAVSQQKTVYAGNALSKEQLATLPFAKIEAAMNNQFGDSLANLGVQPGKNIPFVAVFDKVPRDVTDFGVEAAGSTFASQ